MSVMAGRGLELWLSMIRPPRKAGRRRKKRGKKKGF